MIEETVSKKRFVFLKKHNLSFVFFVLLAMFLASPVSQAARIGSTIEYPAGMTMGAPTGAHPPKGLYVLFKPNYSHSKSVDDNGHKTGATATIWAANAQLMWVPGIKILGADYAAFVRNIGAVNIQTKAPDGTKNAGTGKPDTEIIPINLSWKLSDNLYFGAELGFYLKDGEYHNEPGRINIGQNAYTFEPNVSLSYISDKWLFNAHAVVDINTRNRDAGWVDGDRVSYRNGSTLTVDYTAFRKSGDWAYGLVGYGLTQFTSDSGPSALDGGRPKELAIGPGFSYSFGRVSAIGTYTRDVYARNSGKKNMFLLALTAKLF